MRGLLSGRYGATKGLLVLLVGVAIATSVVSVLYAGGTRSGSDGTGKKQFVEKHIPDGSRLKLRMVAPSAETRERIGADYGVRTVDDTLGYVLGRSADGTISGACVFVERMLAPYDEPHHVGVALSPRGEVTAVALIGPHGEYAAALQTDAFLSQFARERLSDGYRLGDGIDAVSGATMSSELVVDVVNMVMGVFRETVMEGE